MTTEQTGKSLEELLEEINAAAAESEVAKAAKTTLEGLIQLRLTEGQALEDALPGLNSRWKDNDERIRAIVGHLEQCHGRWKAPSEANGDQNRPRDAICAHVFKPIAELRSRLEGKLGPCELRLRRADYRLDLATQHFEAWKTISKWTSTRLDEVKKLIDEVCTLDHCKDNRFALYLAHFELLPKHYQLKTCWDKVAKEYQDPVAHYCPEKTESNCPPKDGEAKKDDTKSKLVHFPWLLGQPPGEALKAAYGAWLQQAWQAQFEAGKEKARAKVAVDEIEQLKTRLATLARAEAKRQRAKDALRGLKSDERDEPGKQDDPGKQPDPDCPPDPSPTSQTQTAQTAPAPVL